MTKRNLNFSLSLLVLFLGILLVGCRNKNSDRIISHADGSSKSDSSGDDSSGDSSPSVVKYHLNIPTHTNGKVSVNGINHDDDYGEDYAVNSTIQLIAIPDSSYKFI